MLTDRAFLWPLSPCISGRFRFTSTMPAAVPPPTPELAEISEIIGLGDARELARTFLADAPRLIADLDNSAPANRSPGSPPRCRLAAHSLKSTSRLVGAHPLSALAATLELRLIAAGPAPTATEIEAIRAEFARFSPALLRFVGSE